jgi:hypothetical protein
MERKPHIKLAHSYWKNILTPNDIAFDMTCGNGHDTKYLLSLGAKVFAFDIQDKAIEETSKRAPGAILEKCSFDSLPPLPTPTLIVYNLGYLPGGNKTITTLSEATIESVKRSLSILGNRGAISITCYPGHAEGEVEESSIKNLLSKTYDVNVCFHQWINREKAPSLFWITKS